MVENEPHNFPTNSTYNSTGQDSEMSDDVKVMRGDVSNRLSDEVNGS